MRKFLRLVVLGLVLLVVMMLSAVTAMRFAIHGREVQVPKLIGLTMTKAEQTALANGLTLSVEDKFYSSAVPQGSVLSQVPSEGVRVRRGGHLRIALSLGSQRAEIPNVVGQSMRAAEINIQRRGLELGSTAITTIPGATPGQIIGQSPPPNASSVTAPRINVLISSDSQQDFLMPSFLGKKLADVTPVIEEAGFKLGAITGLKAAPTVPSATSAPTPVATPAPAPANSPLGNIIVKQNPAPGQKIQAGATISFEVVR